MKAKIAGLLLVALLVLSGCVQLGLPGETGPGIAQPQVIPIAPIISPEPAPGPKADLLKELDLVETVPKGKRLKVEVVYSGINGIPGLCYFGAFTMLAKYIDPTIDLSETITASGLGVNALYVPEMKILLNGRGIGAIGEAAENLGFDYYLGAGKDGILTDEFLAADFPEKARQVVDLENREAAALLLKRLIASNIPVAVHLDIHYAKDAFVSVSPVWAGIFAAEPEGHPDHYVTVTGYDAEVVYVNDPTESYLTKAKDIKVPWEYFMEAWQHGSDWQISEAARAGPYWMLFLSPARKTAKDRAELVSFNKQLAEEKDTVHAIRQFAEGPPNVMEMPNCVEIAKARQEFAIYLRSHGFKDAGEKFRQSGMAFERLCTSPTQMKDLQFIADIEEAGLKLLR